MSLIANCLFVILAQDPGAIEAECARFHAGSDTIKKEALNAIAKLSKPGEPQTVAIAEALANGLKHGNYEVRKLAVRLMTSKPNVEVATRELLLAAKETVAVQQAMTNSWRQLEDRSPKQKASQSPTDALRAAMKDYDATVKKLQDHEKAQASFAPYHQALMTSLAALPSRDTVSVLAANLAAMPRGQPHVAIVRSLATTGSLMAANALLAHLVAVEKSLKVDENKLKRAKRQRPGRKVPPLFSKQGWVKSENSRIARLQWQMRGRVEDWKVRRAEVRAALLQLAEKNGLKGPRSSSAASWRAWIKQNRELLPEKV